VNGDAIYGTTASRFTSLPWGRSTTKGATIYLHVFDWPKDGRLIVPGLKTPVTAARLLAGGAALKVATDASGIIVQVPPAAPDPIASVIELRLQGEPQVGS
jgi:alpha-L-fucosidase